MGTRASVAVLVVVALGAVVAPVLAAGPARAQGAAPAVVDPAADPPPAPSAFPDEETLRALAVSDMERARPVLRRVARSAPDARARTTALQLLGARDASAATARICARVLRVDLDPLVRRAAAECLGRAGPAYGGPHTAALVAALQDPTKDVVTMAGWALAAVGDAASLAAVTAQARHEDPRVARLFYGYTERMRARLGLRYEEEAVGKDATGNRLVPPPAALVADSEGLEVALSTGWLAVYGVMVGWLHGGFTPAAQLGTPGVNLAALTALGGAAVGAAAGGTYGFLRANRLQLAQTVVELGTFGTLAGYGAGVLSGSPPASAVATSELSLLGTLAGTAAGIALAETRPPSPGALALGVAVGTGTAISVGAIAGGYGFSLGNALGASLFTGGLAGAAAVVVVGDEDVGLFPMTGATIGGLAGAATTAVLMGIVENAQLGPQQFTEGVGWATAAGYGLGAVTGGSLALLVPEQYDPFLSSSLKLQPPVLSIVEDPRDGRAIPVAMVAGTF